MCNDKWPLNELLGDAFFCEVDVLTKESLSGHESNYYLSFSREVDGVRKESIDEPTY